MVFTDNKRIQNILQILIYLFVNSMFILKYLPRLYDGSVSVLVAYLLVTAFFILFFPPFTIRFPEKMHRFLFWGVIVSVILGITVILIKIDPFTVRVDRWSAVSYFLDAMFKGNYPYGVHTHVSTTNYPSPFPVWHLLNIPFFLMGDMGLALIFFFLLTAFSVYNFFRSYRKSTFFLILLLISPAYWWEMAVRSDSLSNALLVFNFLLLYKKYNFDIKNNLVFTAIICGLIAGTRFSAMIPIALFFFKPWLELVNRDKIRFVLIVAGIFLLAFLPFVFWDTKNWIFFSRNPFMSQTSVGSPYVLIVMVGLGVWLSLKWTNFVSFAGIMSVFLLLFMQTSLITLRFVRDVDIPIFDDSLYDISYLNLLLPYCIFSIVCLSNWKMAEYRERLLQYEMS